MVAGQEDGWQRRRNEKQLNNQPGQTKVEWEVGDGGAAWRGRDMKGNATISWHVERQWSGRLTMSALQIIPYPEAGSASRAELLEYASHSIWQKTCEE
jgi:hypothetical protein